MSKILQTTGDDLARLAGEMLKTSKGNHWFAKAYTTVSGKWKRCRKCNNIFSANTPREGPCGIDPISITPENAFKWRDWCVKENAMAFRDSLEEVYDKSPDSHVIGFNTWLCIQLTPTHIMQAVLLTVERSNK